ncbi:MAG: hypothetical protein ACJ8M1_14940 [Chthoniobacterales bacterium]
MIATRLQRLGFLVVLFFSTVSSWATLGNAWHIPTNSVPNSGDQMRAPLSPNTNTTVAIYVGNQYQGSGNPGTANGGTVFYKAQSSNAPYLTASLSSFTTSNNDSFFKATFQVPPSDTGVIQYYIQLNYSDGHENTFIYGNDNGSSTTNSQSLAGTNAFTLTMPATLTVNGVNADYTTSHVFVDEINGDAVPFTIVFNPNQANVDPATVQVYTNLNRRDLATLPYTDGNGLATEEGISPPSGDVVGTNDNHYYKAYPMSGGSGQYGTSLNAQKTGAYRLSARFRINNSSTWIYYTSSGRRDHAIVVSPKNARDISLYELNTLNVNATGDQPNQRGTFPDLHDPNKRVNLNYIKSLGCNYLWFQPVHPNGIDGRQVDSNTGHKFTVGSPYAVKNFFEIMPLMARNFNPTSTDPNSDDRSGNDTAAGRALAKTDFHDFVVAADSASVGVMLDAAFNHTAYDAELAQPGVTLIKPGALPTDEIRAKEARFFSYGDIFNVYNNQYCQRSPDASHIAPAPDRFDFGKFGDTFDIFFGHYAALVCINDPPPQGNDSHRFDFKNQGDWFDYGDGNWIGTDFSVAGPNNTVVNNNITRNVWRYFAQYIPYWLSQTGHVDSNNNLIGNSTNPDPIQRRIEDSRGLDALRADFGQGLPPQCWEYIINAARSYKWNFVFMTESLDGGEVTYRSNRHFDILNESILFDLKSAGTTDNYRSVFDGRRNSYGQSLVLLNTTSHDEENYDDPFQALIRYGVCNTIDGAPMIFYGQENGISRQFGFSHYEIDPNFAKYLPHFKVFNDLGPILGNQTFGLQQLFLVYSAITDARQFSPALRSPNRYYLNLRNPSNGNDSNSSHSKIFSIAKYDTANASPGRSDVVFGFVNLDRDNPHPDPAHPEFNENTTFYVNITQNGSNLFGINSGRHYNIRNIAAYTGQDVNRRNRWLWSNDPQSSTPGRLGSDVLTQGVSVLMNKVPATNGDWSTAPYEAQYLKLYDIDAPGVPAASPQITNSYGYKIGNAATFTWATDPNVVPNYMVTVTLNGNIVANFNTTSNSFTYQANYGDKISISIKAVNQDSNVQSNSASSSTVTLLNANADQDGDGMTNAAEDAAGTNPFDANSLFKISDQTRIDANHIAITWTTVSGKNYQLQSITDPNAAPDAALFTAAAPVRTASGDHYTEIVAPAHYFRVVLAP